jgi:hypothetical protein
MTKALNIKITSKGLRPAGLFRSALAGIGQNGAKYIEVNMLMQFLQGVPQTTQCGKSLAFIKKRGLECSHTINTQH